MRKFRTLLFSYFLSFGVTSFFLMFLRNFKPQVMEQETLYAAALTLFVNLAAFQLLYKADVSLAELWIRRILWIGLIAVTTPVIFILFGCVEPERYLIYFITSVLLIELLVFVIYLITDRQTTRMTLDRINEALRKNREE